MGPAELALLISAICFVESNHSHNAINVMDGGSASYGKCQMKLATARELGFKGSVSELWLNPEVNQYWAEQYLHKQIRRYSDVRKGVAAYNAGSVKGEIRNVKYVNKVFKQYERLLRERNENTGRF